MIRRTARVPATEDHEERETLRVAVIVPGHAERGAPSALFERTRAQLIARERGRCWVTGMTAEESGAPLEAHHHPIERCFAERIDWARFSKECLAGKWGPHAQAFDWVGFFQGVTTVDGYARPRDPYLFVDDMTVNGMLLCKKSHTGADEGIHQLPYPLLLARKLLTDGYRFSDTEVIHHAQLADVGNGDPPPPGH